MYVSERDITEHWNVETPVQIFCRGFIVTGPLADMGVGKGNSK